MEWTDGKGKGRRSHGSISRIPFAHFISFWLKAHAFFGSLFSLSFGLIQPARQAYFSVYVTMRQRRDWKEGSTLMKDTQNKESLVGD